MMQSSGQNYSFEIDTWEFLSFSFFGNHCLKIVVHQLLLLPFNPLGIHIDQNECEDN